MLENMISKELVQLNVKASDWQDAITLAAQPLVEQGKIEGRYIEGIIESMKKFGPYFVLIPHVALPHARPEDGAIENAIGITTLAEPVKFGNENNDPVKYIFTLSATVNDTHLEALGSLSELFEKEDFFKLLDETNDVQEVISYLNKV